MKVMGKLAALYFLVLPLSAQFVLPESASEAATLAPYFRDPLPKDEVKFRCSIFPYQPRLSFGFHYWGGFDLTVPVTEFAAAPKDKPVALAAEITNAEGKRTYLYQRSQLPQNIPDEYWTRKRVDLILGGGYLLGVGKYKAKVLLVDGLGRTCRHDFKLSAPNVKAPVPIPPGEVRPNDWSRWPGIPEKSTAESVTVYLHAAPLYTRRNITRLNSWDKAVLMGSLTSLLNASRFARARLVVFNLDARRILFESEDFNRRDFQRLARTLDSFNMGTVSVQTLAGAGEAQFFEEVVLKGSMPIAGRPKSDAAVFLGPAWRWGNPLTPLLRELRPQLPETVYLELGSVFSNNEDIVRDFVKSGRGKVISVYGPLDLAKAIRQIDERVERAN